jgi:hypothetical protein
MARNDRNPNNNENSLFKALTEYSLVRLYKEEHRPEDN